MGTMVGDDGDPGQNQIGVAPHARWIAAKGCEDLGCSDSALLASGQWILAPTDLAGQNPRPDLAPNVVNSSWGSDDGSDPFYQAIVDAWNAAGIFPAFSNGNNGFAGCGTVGSPGSYLNSYGAGAFDINNAIADFSSRGPSPFGGELKPNLSAPGVAVRSSVPGDGYDLFDGTSMASPHVAATVALMWSAAPSLAGQIDATRQLLDDTAVDVEDLSCGGTADDNNVWGEGRLDAFAAVDQAPRGPTGTLTGTVTDEATGAPLEGAAVRAVGESDRTTFSGPDGTYSIVLPVGTYEVTASRFGYLSETAGGVTVTEGATTTQDLALAPAPAHQVSGHVHDGEGNPLAGATVTILGTPIPPATTDADGRYSFASVPEGTYEVTARLNGCYESQTQALVVDGDEVLDFVLPQRSDAFGYTCTATGFEFVDATNALPLSGDDASVPVTLPFPFTFYGTTYTSANVTTNGFLSFVSPEPIFFNGPIPSPDPPNGAIYPFWDDLFVDDQASVRTEVVGAEPNRSFVVEWENVAFFADLSKRVNFEVVLTETGRITFQYQGIDDDGMEEGSSATIGIENAAGDDALQYSFDEASVTTGTAILFSLPPSGFVEGTVTDANDGEGIAGATVRALQDGAVVRQTTTGADGHYRLQVPLGSYTIEATARNYSTETAEVTVDQENEVVTADFALETARAEISPTALELVVPPGEQRTRQLTLRNTGSADLEWELREAGGGRVTTGSTRDRPKADKVDPNARTTKGLYAGGTPRGWSPTAPGDVLASWPATGLALAWGVGYDGNVWLSDVPDADRNHEFTTGGTPTGRNWPAPWAGEWPADMARDTTHNLICQLAVGADNGIHCWDPSTGTVVDSITGAFPWTAISQRGLAYRPDDDSFYVGGWNEGIVYHVKGLSHPDKGAVIGQCSPADPNISGLAWNSAFNVVWAATNSPTDTIYELDPDTCTVLTSLAHPQPGFNGAGLELDDVGNLWTVSQAGNTAYLIESGVPRFTDVPWLSEEPTSGTLPTGGEQLIQVTVDTTGLEPGAYDAQLILRSNSGREPDLRIPVRLIVPAYQVGANAGGDRYVDGNGDTWLPDQAFSAGSWGYLGDSSRDRSNHPIAGTEDDPLYQDLRRNMYAYRLDGLADGVYQVELRFAELQQVRPNRHLFDVILENDLVLPAHDIAYEVGSFTADDHSFFVRVEDGTLDVRFIRRAGYGRPIVNALRVTSRPDQ
jgi:Subtilase family/Malectin domain/Carboxypeptidase regulatory-like domain